MIILPFLADLRIFELKAVPFGIQQTEIALAPQKFGGVTTTNFLESKMEQLSEFT
jgi:hypothetical protein